MQFDAYRVIYDAPFVFVSMRYCHSDTAVLLWYLYRFHAHMTIWVSVRARVCARIYI